MCQRRTELTSWPNVNAVKMPEGKWKAQNVWWQTNWTKSRCEQRLRLYACSLSATWNSGSHIELILFIVIKHEWVAYCLVALLKLNEHTFLCTSLPCWHANSNMWLSIMVAWDVRSKIKGQINNDVIDRLNWNEYKCIIEYINE